METHIIITYSGRCVHEPCHRPVSSLRHVFQGLPLVADCITHFSFIDDNILFPIVSNSNVLFFLEMCKEITLGIFKNVCNSSILFFVV